MPRSVTLLEDGYTWASYGNGWAYLVTRTGDGATFYVAGDDATGFRSNVLEQDVIPFGAALAHYGYDALFELDLGATG